MLHKPKVGETAEIVNGNISFIDVIPVSSLLEYSPEGSGDFPVSSDYSCQPEFSKTDIPSIPPFTANCTLKFTV
jgi:hypothetical protein